ncbi:MAG: tRNA (adenosine(37)-N6)-dimethylallyltransferase MiaA, partial [Gammaproteobacteria bacterium]|nr:tRNA (adenosine(37)-N6)-dimethylallyltransferase MiaA [Gammaproteobacteria bacterium]
MGPTASGKSDIALQLAEHFPIEIISVDSALIYRGMDIGTAKPTTEMRAQVPHHLIDICDPRESYSVARFCNDVTETVQSVFAREKIPVLVGGTMMYFRALLS